MHRVILYNCIFTTYIPRNKAIQAALNIRNALKETGNNV